MPGPAGEGMAPLRNRSEDAGREWVGEGARLLRRNDVSRRQDTGSEDKDEEGRRRFRFGNNNGGGGGNDGENDREGRFGGFFRSGGRGGNDNNNGRGGNDNGGGTGNDNGGTGNGNGSGSGSGNGRGDGNGNGFGGGRGDGNGNGFGEGRFGDRRFGEGFGFGRDRNRNNGDGNSSQTQNSPAETPSPSPSPQPQPPSTSTAPPPPPPETTTATESAPSPEVAPSTTVEASSAFNPGVILLQSAVTGGPTAEVSTTMFQLCQTALTRLAGQPDCDRLHPVDDTEQCSRLDQFVRVTGERRPQRFIWSWTIHLARAESHATPQRSPNWGNDGQRRWNRLKQ